MLFSPVRRPTGNCPAARRVLRPNALRRALVVILVVTAAIGCTPEPVETGPTVYPQDVVRTACNPGARAGGTGVINDLRTAAGIQYNVRTPSNYDAGIAHPLIVVYAPAGRSRHGSERFTGLTPDATRAGFIIAYADHRRMSKTAILELGSIPQLVSADWCIDPQRIFLTGHSDGGSVAMGLGFLPQTRNIPSAIAPGAAGIRGEDLAEYRCPAPLPVMLMHSRNDALFPGFGREAAEWWAACNGCDPLAQADKDSGCSRYRGCSAGGSVWYCEGEGHHSEWPGINAQLIGFFSALPGTAATPVQPEPSGGAR